jgi:glycosyltransferase involved in cell wall biosynthesis
MNILFVMPSANMGGSTSSLCNMLDLLNMNGIKSDVFLMSHTGVMFNEIQKRTRILPECFLLASAVCRKDYLKSKYGLKGVFFRSLIAFGNRLGTPYLNDLLYKRVARRITDYDVVIAYQENFATDFARFIPAKTRIAWVHTMFDRFVVSYKKLKHFYNTYEKYDKIVCVAEGAAKAFCEGATSLREKVHLINNPLIPENIINRANEDLPYDLSKHMDDNCTCIVSIGRLSPEKQYDLAVTVAKELDLLGKRFIWFIAGDGPEKDRIMELIKKNGLENKVLLTGILLNPYPLIKRADVLVISSIYEAQPMVANEALILDTPVITTNYPTAYTLIDDRVNGIICDNSCASLKESLLKYIDDDVFADSLKLGAKNFTYNNNNIFNSLKDLIHG